jgi:sorbitol/mannitol transport system permease protein
MFRKEKLVNLLEAPGLLLVFVITQIPFVVTIVLSFMSWNVKRPDLKPAFTGVSNYFFLFKDEDFYRVLLNTVVITGLSLVLGLALGFLLALLFNRDFRGVGVARSILVMPYFVMEPVIGIVWKTLILGANNGLSSVLFRFVGLDPISFFDSQHALWTITLLCTWQWTPFLFLILLSGLQSLPEEVIESAQVDGAGPLQQVLYFKIPLMAPYFKVAAMFGLINLFKVFGVIFVTTQGGPGVASANLSYYVYRTGFYDWQIGRAAAISVVMVVITLLIVNVLFRFQGDVTKRG